MADEATTNEDPGQSEETGSTGHEIERAVARLNEWFAQNKRRIPSCFDWRSLRRKRLVPLFKAVRTTEIKDWGIEELGRLFRVVREEAGEADREEVVPIELLVADKSLAGGFLEVEALMAAVLNRLASPFFLGRFSPRLWWFWWHYPPFIEEIGSYVHGIRLRVDAATPVKHNQYRVFEDFSVPLENGQQTAIGQGCFFVLDYMQPHRAVPYWRYSLVRDGETIVGPAVLQAKPIYHQEQLLAVIKKISDTTVTLSVLTSEGG
jgi:hypothetical protein